MTESRRRQREDSDYPIRLTTHEREHQRPRQELEPATGREAKQRPQFEEDRRVRDEQRPAR